MFNRVRKPGETNYIIGKSNPPKALHFEEKKPNLQEGNLMIHNR